MVFLGFFFFSFRKGGDFFWGVSFFIKGFFIVLVFH